MGALLAALMVGFLHALGSFWIPQFATVLVYALMAIVLILKPSGLFGVSE